MELYRHQLRHKVFELLRDGNTNAGANVYENRTFPLQAGQMPAILVYTHNSNSEFLTQQTTPECFTHLDIHILGRAEASSSEEVAEQLDLITEYVRICVLQDPDFIQMISWVEHMSEEFDYKDNEALTYGTVTITLKVRYQERFYPNLYNQYTGGDIYIDAAGVAVDPNGTYTPPFPYPVNPPPRTNREVDGRIEIGGKFEAT